MRLIFLSLCTFSLAFSSHADISNETIRAYNSAIAQGDRSAIIETSKALAAAAVANPEHSQSVLLAFEAGHKLCELDQCAEAQAAANYVATSAITDPDAHPVAEDRALLASFSNWSVDKNRRTRKAFDTALTPLVSLPPTNLTIKAMQARHFYDFETGKYRKASNSAGQAGDHIRPVADQIPRAYVAAEKMAAISGFNSAPNRSVLSDLVHLQGWLAQHRVSLGEDAPDWVEKEEFRTHAWELAIEAWFVSSNKKSLSEAQRDDIMSTYDTGPDITELLEAAKATALLEGIAALPFCEGELLQRPPLRYPLDSFRQGRYGAVIVGFNIEDGQVADVVVKAAVPSDEFEDQASSTVSQWTWKANSDQNPGVDCSMSRKDVVQPLVFALD